jgi:hypothetical protein
MLPHQQFFKVYTFFYIFVKTLVQKVMHSVAQHCV